MSSNMQSKPRASYNRPNITTIHHSRKPIASTSVDDILYQLVQTATLTRSASTQAAYDLRMRNIFRLVKLLASTR